MDDPHIIRKRSVRVAGHRTSLSLEAAFWDQLKAIAAARGLSLNKLVEEIDNARTVQAKRANLSSAIRIYILRSLMKTP